MRKIQAKHQALIVFLTQLPVEEAKRRIRIRTWDDVDWVPPEVLATFVRDRFGSTNGLVQDAAEVLTRRVVQKVERQVHAKPSWSALAVRDSSLTQEASDFVIDAVLTEPPISNCQVYFNKFLRERLTDFMRKVYSERAATVAIEDMNHEDDEGDTHAYVDTLEDSDQESPEENAIRKAEERSVRKALRELPHDERNAFYYRIECGYKMDTVAEFLKCSVPTARNLVKRSVNMLLGALNQ